MDTDNGNILDQIKCYASVIINRDELEILKKYQQHIQIAKFANFTDILDEQLFQIIDNGQTQQLIINGNLLQDDVNIEQLYLFFIKHLDQFFTQCLDQDYNLQIFCLLKNKFKFQINMIDFFYKLRTCLPQKYTSNVNIVYFINSGLIIRTYVLFLDQYQKQKKIKNIHLSLQKLQELNLLNAQTFNKIQNLQKSQNSINQMNSNLNLKKNIDEYEISENNVPETLLHILLINQNILDQKEYLGCLVHFPNYSNDYGKLIECVDPKIIADLIKKFLRDLKTPLIPYKFYEDFLNLLQRYKTEEEQIEQVKSLIQNLPLVNKMTLIYLFKFFITFTYFHEENLMNKDNFAILITPCIFRCISDDPLKELLESKQLVNTTKLIFRNDEQIFQDLILDNLINKIPEYN